MGDSLEVSELVFIGLRFIALQNKYEIYIADDYDAYVYSYNYDRSSVYVVNEDDIPDLLQKLDEYIAEHDIPPRGNAKISEHRALFDIYLVRYDEESFMVFNRYQRNFSGIPEIGIEFKKIKEEN